MAVKLVLNIDGKKRTFTQTKISGRKMREIFKFYETMENVESGKIEMSDLEMLDQMIVLAEIMFDNPEVTFDAILDGLEASELAPSLRNVFEQVMDMGQGEKKTQQKKQ